MDAANHVIGEEQCTLVERLLCENISLHGICHAVGVSIRWFMNFIVTCVEALPDHLHVQPVASPRDVIIGRLEVEADEMWSLVKQKAYKPWIGIAMDTQTRQIMAFHLGDCSHDSAKKLWANLPAVYREQATFYMDQYEVYNGGIPAAQHKTITKKSRKTNHIERFNHTLRQRVSVSYVTCWHSPKSWPVISAPSRMLSAMTTLPGLQPYLYHTTVVFEYYRRRGHDGWRRP